MNKSTKIIVVVLVSAFILYLIYQYTKNTPRKYTFKDLMNEEVVKISSPISKGNSGSNNSDNSDNGSQTEEGNQS